MLYFAHNDGEIIIMKKKIIIVVVMIAILAAAIVTVAVINNKPGRNTKLQSFGSIEEALEATDIKIEYSDRLCGIPATDFVSNSSTIEVKYGEAGFTRKTLGVADNSGQSDFSEVTEQNVGGRDVTLKGNDGKVYLAVWNDNNFAYTISVNSGIDADEMIEYIEATR